MHMNDLMARALAGALIGLAAVPGGKEAWAQQRTTIQLVIRPDLSRLNSGHHSRSVRSNHPPRLIGNRR